MTIGELLDHNTNYKAALIQVYYDWLFSVEGSETEELLARMLAHMANEIFDDVEEKKTFLLSLNGDMV